MKAVRNLLVPIDKVERLVIFIEDLGSVIIPHPYRIAVHSVICAGERLVIEAVNRRRSVVSKRVDFRPPLYDFGQIKECAFVRVGGEVDF